MIVSRWYAGLTIHCCTPCHWWWDIESFWLIHISGGPEKVTMADIVAVHQQVLLKVLDSAINKIPTVIKHATSSWGIKIDTQLFGQLDAESMQSSSICQHPCGHLPAVARPNCQVINDIFVVRIDLFASKVNQ